MKALVVLVICVFCYQLPNVLSRAVEDDKLEPEEIACIEELHLNRRIIASINNRDIAPDDDPSFNNFIECYYKKMGWLNNEGELDYTKYKDIMQEAIGEELEEESPAVRKVVKDLMLNTITECEQNPPPKGDSHGQTAIRIQNCVMQNLVDLMNET